MAGGLYSAGKVGVDVVPDTSLFWAKLHADLASHHPEVKIGVNMDGVAKAERQLNRLDGRTLTNVVKIEGDDSGIRRIGQQLEKVRKEWANRPIAVKYELDDTAFPKQLKALQTKAKATGVFSKDTSLTDSLWDSMTRLRVLQAKYQQDAEKYAKQRTKLKADEQAMYAMFADEIDGNRKRVDQLNKSITDTNNVLEWSRNRMKELRAEGDKAGADWFKNTRIPELRDRLKALKQDLRDVDRELKANEREQSKLFGKEYEKKISDLGSLIEQNVDKWAKAAEAEAKYTNSMQRHAAAVADFHRSTRNMVSALRRSLDLQEDADKVAKEYAKTLPKVSEGEQALADALSGNTGLFTDLSGAASDAGGVMERNRQIARELTEVLGKQEDQIRGLAAAIEQFKPMGIDKLTGKQFNQTIRQIQELKDAVSKRPVEMKMRLDKGDWDREYADVLHKAEDLRSKLEREHEVDVRVKVWDDNADNLEQRLDQLRHTRVDVPVDWQVDQEQLIASMRETAAKIKANPERRWELEANLDVQMHHAEEQLKDFEDRNNELRMDLDLETALARAHLAYFTRPRTIDIFANFKGTDLGKIFNGATFGATGLKGVQNEFQKLVTMFDSLDRVVPKWSLLGAGLTSLGAGLLNLGRTAGGVGTSLLSMSKAALAAPAALTGLGAAGFVAYSAMKTMGDQFDITRTKLAGLQSDVGKAFWTEAGQAITSMADSVNDDLRPALVGIATSEGQMVAGLMKVIEQSNAADQLPRIFANTDQAIQALNPGVQSLARAFLGLGDQSSQYLPRMASYVSNVADGWARWVDTASKTGQITTGMQDAIEQGGYLKSSVVDLIGVMGGLYRPLAEDQNGLQVFAENIHKANEAVNSFRFQETMQAWVDGATAAQAGLRNSFKDVGDAFYSLRDVTTSVFADAGQIVGSGITAISRVLQQSGTGIRDFSSGIRDGFTEAFDAIGDAGPMFSELESMVGSMSRTFGGTFANTLKAAAPSIQAVATAAGTVANLFNALPGPMQGVIGMWMTLGRAGLQAFTSLKTGMLQNIQNTMQYQWMLSELGLSADKASVSMMTLVRAMGQLRSGNYAGVLSNAVRQVDEMGAAAERNAQKLQEAGRASKEYGSSTTTIVSQSGNARKALQEVGDEAAKSPSRLSKLASAATGVVNAFGGWGNIAFMGISAGISLVGTAISDYTAKAEASKKATADAVAGLATLQSSSSDAAKAMTDYRKQMTDSWSESSTSFDGGALGFFEKLGTQMTGGFTDAKSAADSLGISTKQLTDAVSGNETEYNKLKKQLTAVSGETETVTGAYGQVQVQFTRTAQAAQTVLSALEKQHKEGWQKASDEMRKYLDSADAVNDMTSNFSASLDLMNSSVQANGVVFQQTGQLIDSSNQAGQRTVSMFQDVASNALLAAQQMMAYGEKTGETGKYTQLATNAIYQAREAIVQQAVAAGKSQQAAEAYADSLGLIPSNVGTTITADTTMARGEVESLLNSISGLTDSQKQIILELSDKGVLTSLGGVENMITQLMGGKVSQRALTLLMNADGDAEWKTKNVKSNLEALGMSPKTYEWLLNGNGTAEERMQKVKDSLSDLNLTPKQIQWILDCIDNASATTDKAKQDKADLSNPISYTISVNDQTAAAFAAVQARAEVLEDGKTVVISGDDTDYLNKVAQVTGTQIDPKTGTLTLDKSQFDIAMALAAGAKIDPKTGLLKGDNSDMMRKVAEANGWKIDEKTVVIKGDNGQALSAIAYVNAQRVGEKNFSIIARDNATQVVSRLQKMTIANKTFTVTAYYTSAGEKVIGGTIPKNAATGGRIFGPGTGTSDSIHAMLSNGEMVLRASSVRKLDAKYGKGFLDALNTFGDVEKAKASPSPTALRYRARSYALASGGRVSDIKAPVIQISPIVNGGGSSPSVSAEDMQAAVASGVSAALKASQMKLAFDARGAARVMAEPMSHEIGLLERSGRIR